LLVYIQLFATTPNSVLKHVYKAKVSDMKGLRVCIETVLPRYLGVAYSSTRMCEGVRQILKDNNDTVVRQWQC